MKQTQSVVLLVKRVNGQTVNTTQRGYTFNAKLCRTVIVSNEAKLYSCYQSN